MHHFLHWVLKWIFTIATVWSFVAMCKQMSRPLASRTVVQGGRRVRLSSLDNMLDNVGAFYGLVFFAAITLVLWAT
jgi:hypothetical protein